MGQRGHSRKTVEKAISNEPLRHCHLTKARSLLVFGPFQARADALLEENERLPHKQRYTAYKLFELLPSSVNLIRVLQEPLQDEVTQTMDFLLGTPLLWAGADNLSR